jgi:hypothetical protein
VEATLPRVRSIPTSPAAEVDKTGSPSPVDVCGSPARALAEPKADGKGVTARVNETRGHALILLSVPRSILIVPSNCTVVPSNCTCTRFPCRNIVYGSHEPLQSNWRCKSNAPNGLTCIVLIHIHPLAQLSINLQLELSTGAPDKPLAAHARTQKKARFCATPPRPPDDKHREWAAGDPGPVSVRVKAPGSDTGGLPGATDSARTDLK